ncbi:MAG: UDP-N-acetylglucosamine 2-epimerase (hydrolyzing), partial [Pygmaiobacter sp.]
LRCASILDCTPAQSAIEKALHMALSPAFAEICKTTKSPYNGGETSGEIVRILTGFLNSGLAHTTKVFFDAPLAERYY